MHASQRRSILTGLALAVTGSALLSGKAIVVKLAYRYGVDPLTAIALRMALAAPLFVVAYWWAARGAPPLTRGDHGRLLILGVLGYYLASYAKFFHRRFPRLRTHGVVETDERVIATARSLFHVPADDARLSIEHGDGVAALAPECCDLLVVDGFEDEATPSALVSQEFFDAAWCALEEPGAFVMNVMNDDRLLDRHLQRIERAFDGAVIAFPSLRDPNIVVLGLKGAPVSVDWPTLRARADALAGKFGLPFPRYVERMRSMNQWSAAALAIRPQSPP